MDGDGAGFTGTGGGEGGGTSAEEECECLAGGLLRAGEEDTDDENTGGAFPALTGA